jgi:hypothetical protein
MNLHVTPLGLAAVGLGWILIACAIATVPHRAKRALRAADPGEDCDCYSPPTSAPVPCDDWMSLVPADCLRDDDPVLHARFASIISHEWEWSE